MSANPDYNGPFAGVLRFDDAQGTGQTKIDILCAKLRAVKSVQFTENGKTSSIRTLRFDNEFNQKDWLVDGAIVHHLKSWAAINGFDKVSIYHYEGEKSLSNEAWGIDFYY